MKKVMLSIAICFMSVVFFLTINNGIALALKPGPYEVILYSIKDFQGNLIWFTVNKKIPNLKKVKTGDMNWNDKVSSVKVGADVKLIAWEHANYKGQCKVFLGSNAGGPGNYHDLSHLDFDDKMSSLKVYDKNDPQARCP